MNMTEFAKRIGVTRSLVSAWVAGLVTPQVGTLSRLCRVFGVPVSYFFEGADDGPPEKQGL